jgi:hypothetical protein
MLSWLIPNNYGELLEDNQASKSLYLTAYRHKLQSRQFSMKISIATVRRLMREAIIYILAYAAMTIKLSSSRLTLQMP